MECDYDWEDGLYELRPLFASQDISIFRNLTDLTVHNIQGDLNSVRSDIVKVLLASPGMKSLSLSINQHTLFRIYHDHNGEPED